MAACFTISDSPQIPDIGAKSTRTLIQKRESDPLEQELWMHVSHHVGLEVKPRSSAKAASTLNCWATAVAPDSLFAKQLHSYCIEISTRNMPLEVREVGPYITFIRPIGRLYFPVFCSWTPEPYDWAEASRIWLEMSYIYQDLVLNLSLAFSKLSWFWYWNDELRMNGRMDSKSLEVLPSINNSLSWLNKSLTVWERTNIAGQVIFFPYSGDAFRGW